jgi:hypothetical protein
MEAAHGIFATAYIVRAAKLIVKGCVGDFFTRLAVSGRMTGGPCHQRTHFEDKQSGKSRNDLRNCLTAAASSV